VLAIARSLALDRPTAVLEVPIPDTVVRHPGEVAVPGRVVDLAVARGAPDDYTVRFTLDSGKVIEATGLEVYDPPAPFADAAEVFFFLILQNTPAELVYRELNAVDPAWEAKVEARRRANDQASRRARGESA